MTLWERVKAGSRSSFDRTWKALDKTGAPVDGLSNTLGAEAFWPATLDKESDKAARILKSFCIDGFYAEEEDSGDRTKQTQKVLKSIPASVIRNAKGLAIFTTMRTGLWLSGAGGSGVLVARKDDGSWSSPSGVLLHTAGLGFTGGIDLYDCVVVINSEAALEAFHQVRCTLGSEVSVTAGPIDSGRVLETEARQSQAPIFTYMKSRGFYAGVQIDGTIIIERGDENERFYGQRMPVKEILEGQMRHPPVKIRRLLETLKAAQGDTDFDTAALPSEPPPSDYEVNGGQVFGVPSKEDPDPYGVLALEKEGMRIVEAGSQKRASWDQFSFSPAPSSPVHSIYARSSTDQDLSFSRRSSWRGSTMSTASQGAIRPNSMRKSVDSPLKISTMIDTSTQTDVQTLSPEILTWSNGLDRRSSRGSTSPGYGRMRGVPEEVLEISPLDRSTTTRSTSVVAYATPPSTPPAEGLESPRTVTPQLESALTLRNIGGSSSVIQSIQLFKPIANPVMAKARLVTVPKRTAPILPPRNPSRSMQDSPPPSRPSSESERSPELSEEATEQSLNSASDLHERDSAVDGEPKDTTIDAETVAERDCQLTKSPRTGSTWEKIRALRAAEDG